MTVLFLIVDKVTILEPCDKKILAKLNKKVSLVTIASNIKKEIDNAKFPKLTNRVQSESR